MTDKTKGSKKSVQPPNPHRPNLWGMIRDVLVASLNKGQFLSALVALIFIAIIYRMPSEEVGKLAHEILDMFKTFKYFGWFLALVVTLGWLITYNIAKRSYLRHLEQLNKEKTALQEKLLGPKQ